MSANVASRRLARVGLCGLVLCAGSAVAEGQHAAKGELEFLVAPGGGALSVPVHAGEVCILSFPERLASSALSSSADFEIKAWGNDGVAVRSTGRATTATLALSTSTGGIKVNLTFRVVPEKEDALTMVRFKPASLEEALEAQISAEVAKRMAPLEAALAASKRSVDEQIRDRADGLIADRLLTRNEIIVLQAHERNDDNVIAHVERAVLLGADGYVFFEIENHSRAPFRLAHVTVTAQGRPLTGPARLLSTAIDRDPRVVGVVPAGVVARGVVVVRGAEQVLGKSLEVELADPDGHGTIRLTRGIALK
jgi:hypothetical protein